MFFLSQIEHSLMLPPHLLNRPLGEAIKEQLDSIFLDKVIDKLGLCVSVYDIRSISGGFILPGDGASTYTEKFRLVFFRPFVGEIITAWLKESTMDALRLSLGFFYDIYVPVPLLFSPNRSELDPGHKNRVAWIWNYKDEDYRVDGEDEVILPAILFISLTSVQPCMRPHNFLAWLLIRFQVHDVRYPPIPLEPKDVKPFAPMVVTGSLDMDGVGPSSWWV
ncbi:DNA-directed RNA polymerase III subunit RPC8-like isoform X2 [Salvia hispanica]|uniref:DNA-directed RNA polymerase III subunit RPC8-like isoform X2 n=1 Tax=Salvia hispanica TaxID=49212 RepID=UPI00200900B9|nr:DNA-directed RNA polymerase III subunit RPC8-like isoform X2 [Salvia hispanica]